METECQSAVNGYTKVIYAKKNPFHAYQVRLVSLNSMKLSSGKAIPISL